MKSEITDVHAYQQEVSVFTCKFYRGQSQIADKYLPEIPFVNVDSTQIICELKEYSFSWLRIHYCEMRNNQLLPRIRKWCVIRKSNGQFPNEFDIVIEFSTTHSITKTRGARAKKAFSTDPKSLRYTTLISLTQNLNKARITRRIALR
jgi:hypothetical protein